MFLAAALLLPRLAAEPPPDAVKLPKPGVQYRVNVASATTRPWVNSNGWRLERGGPVPFYYDAPGNAAALAAAEAFVYGREALVHSDTAGEAAFERMTAFLKSLGEGPAGVMANIGVVDDGSAETGEVMNLLSRRNLLYRVVPAPDPKLNVNLTMPKAENPDVFAQKVRQQITDEKRAVRIYGSEVVLARMTGDGGRVRLHLLNYSDRPVHGLRVRVLGSFSKGTLAAFDIPGAQLQDYEAERGATEFTIAEMRGYAVVDLVTK